jgi:hypothetical protein
VADFPFPIPDALQAEVAAYADGEGKLPRALDRLGELGGRDVVLLDADRGLRARQLAEIGARVISVTGTTDDVPDASADAVVGFWSVFRPSADRAGTGTPGDDIDAELREADRILRPGGRLLVVHEYGRDDLSLVLSPEHAAARIAWSRRDGWFPSRGFRLHVIHAYWTFPDMGRLDDVVTGLFGPTARDLLGDRSRPRLSWKVVVYDRVRGGVATA